MRNLLMALVLFVLVSCSSEDSPAESGQVSAPVSLGFNVSTTRVVTRMLDGMTQQNGMTFRNIKDQRLFPFNIPGKIGAGAVPLSAYLTNMPELESTHHYYLDENSVDVPYTTASFLCYARAVPDEDKFTNGSLLATIGERPNTSDIQFAPEQIYTATDDAGQVKVDEKATAIANYLTEVARKIQDTEDFISFINEGHLVACAGVNVHQMAAWAATKGVDLSSIGSVYDMDYPACINLPDGAAAVRWNRTTAQFDPQVQTTTESNINSLNRFVYPAELYYYSNSRIKTSRSSRKTSYYGKQSWDDVLKVYEIDNGEMDGSVRSVAIKEPLSYAVGCLQIGLVAASTLRDSEGTAITLTDSHFPLKGILVSGQYTQAYDFTPKNEVDEYIIYDKEVSGLSIGAARAAIPTSATPSRYVSTLVLQSKDQVSVRFALEFENNSGLDFKSLNGTVYNGTKFYLVGTIEVPGGQAEEYKKRAFTKDYITQGTVMITGLTQAYPYLPDLLDPRLEIGIKLVPNWVQSSSTNIPL